jgi:hypothetical protein
VLVASSSDYPVTIPPDLLVGIETGVLRWYQDFVEPVKSSPCKQNKFRSGNRSASGRD